MRALFIEVMPFYQNIIGLNLIEILLLIRKIYFRMTHLQKLQKNYFYIILLN